MRVVLLASSPWGEVAVASAVSLAEAGYPPVGAITLRSTSVRTLLRKSRQWGPGTVARYAFRKLTARGSQRAVQNADLLPVLSAGGRPVRSLGEAGERYGFEAVGVRGINDPAAVGRVRSWRPDLVVYNGGGIVRRSLLDTPRIGVLNAHAGLLPEIRGMSAPEWSLLTGVTPGVTVHLMDEGVDTGPVLSRRALPADEIPDSLAALRHRLAALGVALKTEAVCGLDDGTLEPVPQAERDRDRQHFVMHEALREVAERRLAGAASGRGTAPRRAALSQPAL